MKARSRSGSQLNKNLGRRSIFLSSAGEKSDPGLLLWDKSDYLILKDAWVDHRKVLWNSANDPNVSNTFLLWMIQDPDVDVIVVYSESQESALARVIECTKILRTAKVSMGEPTESSITTTHGTQIHVSYPGKRLEIEKCDRVIVDIPLDISDQCKLWARQVMLGLVMYSPSVRLVVIQPMPKMRELWQPTDTNLFFWNTKQKK